MAGRNVGIERAALGTAVRPVLVEAFQLIEVMDAIGRNEGQSGEGELEFVGAGRKGKGRAVAERFTIGFYIFDDNGRRNQVADEVSRIHQGNAFHGGKSKLAIPQTPAGGLESAVAFVAAKAVTLGERMHLEMFYLAVGELIEIGAGQVKDAAIGAHPDQPGGIFKNGKNLVIGESVLSGRRTEFSVTQTHQAAGVAPQPESAVRIAGDSPNRIGGKAIGRFCNFANGHPSSG